MKTKKKILIVGYAHGGTGSTALVLQKLGLDILHDLHTGNDGSVSWIYAVDDEFFQELSIRYPGQRPPWNIKDHGRQTYDVILHQVRDPLKSIRDVGPEPPWTLEFRLRHCPDIKHPNGLVMGLRSWIMWHELCKSGSQWTYRVEDLNKPSIWSNFLEHCGLDSNLHYPLESKTFNTKRHLAKEWQKNQTWDELFELDPFWSRRAYKFAISMGYQYDIDPSHPITKEIES